MSTALILEKQSRDLGGGFIVGRVLPQAKQRMVGPFVFFDHMGPLDLAPGISPDLDVKPHPHIGLSTVTYLYSGAITHRDSLGHTQEIRPGEVNWMTAGRGITHSERFEYARRHGALMHGIQVWVALPTENEDDDPAFYHYEGAEQLPEWHEDGVDSRLIAGSANGLTAQVKTHSPLFYLDWLMTAGSKRQLTVSYPERAVYVAQGQVELNHHPLKAGQMLVLEKGLAAHLHALSDARVMLLGGEPIGNRFIYWNFVSSSREKIEQAANDWQAQRMKLPINDDHEFVPLPGK